MNTDADLIQRLGRSNLYNEFKQAFCASTGLPLTVRPVEFWQGKGAGVAGAIVFGSNQGSANDELMSAKPKPTNYAKSDCLNNLHERSNE
jgi:hypothetical protein